MDDIKKGILLAPFNILYRISPELDLKILFRLKEGYSLDLKHPKTYNEKLQWIKLYDKDDLKPKCCDKYTVREYVKEKGCEKILNHLIWEGFSPKDIPFDDLPKKYVIKVTHGSTFNIICKDSSKINREEVKKKCAAWLKAKFLPCYGEWFYGVEKPRVIIEDFIESADDEQLRDYKVFCFNGEPSYIRVDTDRFERHRDTVFDCDWNLIPNVHMKHGCGDRIINKPECLKELLEYARILSKPFIHARVDFYIVRDKIYFGEITFTNGAGFDKFSSYDFDLEMGNKMRLPFETMQNN